MTTPTPELAPCPFCGEHLEIRLGANPYGRHHFGSDCLLAKQGINLIPNDIAAWNRRAPSPEAERLREALEDIANDKPLDLKAYARAALTSDGNGGAR